MAHRNAAFSLSLMPVSREAKKSDAFEGSGLAAAWSAALSLPALGPPTMDPTPALELPNKRNALRNRNRDLSELTTESSPPPRTKRRVPGTSAVHAGAVVASPHPKNETETQNGRERLPNHRDRKTFLL